MSRSARWQTASGDSRLSADDELGCAMTWMECVERQTSRYFSEERVGR
jgi:hypothetical protein